jgi:hypothetical protein
MKLTTIFAALIFIALGVMLIYFNATSEAKSADIADSSDSLDCSADCDGSCPMNKMINCGGICDSERKDTCSFHEQDDEYY